MTFAPCGGELASAADVVDLDADVVHPGAAACEEAADVRVLGERGDELDPARAEAQVDGLDPLLLRARPRTSTSAPKSDR